MTGNFAVFSRFDSEYNAETAVDAISGTDQVNTYINVAGQEIALWQQADLSYAFLPSACKGTDLKPEIPEEIRAGVILLLLPMKKSLIRLSLRIRSLS